MEVAPHCSIFPITCPGSCVSTSFLVKVTRIRLGWKSSEEDCLAFVIMMGESIGGEQCSNLAHLPFSKKSGGEKGRVCGFAAPRTTPLALYNYRRHGCTLEKGGGVVEVVWVGKRVGSVPAAGWITITR